MPPQDLSLMQLAFKVQTGLGAQASGAGAYGLDVLPSTGLAKTIAAIESGLIRRNKMKKRPRHGMVSSTAAYETELSVAALDPLFECALGTNAVATTTLTNATLGTITFSGTGGVGTFSVGGLLAAGLTAGMFVRFTGTGVPGNNGIWVPVLSVTNTGVTFAPGYLTDAAASAAYSMDIAKYFSTPTPYVDKYLTVEEYISGADVSKLGVDMRVHSLGVTVAPKAYVKIAVGMTGRDMQMMSGAAAPVFPAPTFVDNEGLILLDGGIYVNGIRRGDLTGFTFGLSSTPSTTDVIGTRISPDVRVGQFALTGSFTALMEDGTDFSAVDTESDISVLLHCKEKDTERFVGFYLGRMTFGGYATPMGGEGNIVQTMSLMAGEDDRGAGFSPTSVLISTSD